MKHTPERVSDFSSLTVVQVETLKIHRARRKNEITMEEALKRRRVSGISRGSHYRVLRQAKNNIKSSLFTVAVAVQLGLIKAEDVQKFVSSVLMIPESLDPEKAPGVLALVSALAERIVMS